MSKVFYLHKISQIVSFIDLHILECRYAKCDSLWQFMEGSLIQLHFLGIFIYYDFFEKL